MTNNTILKTVAEALLDQAGYVPFLMHITDVRKAAAAINPAELLTDQDCRQVLYTTYALQETVEDHSLPNCLSHAVELFFADREEEQEVRDRAYAAEAQTAAKALIKDIELKLAELEGAIGIAAQGGQS